MGNAKFGDYEDRFFETFKENREKIIQHRNQFGNCGNLEDFIDEQF